MSEQKKTEKTEKSDHIRIVVNGKIRLVPKTGNRFTAVKQKTGYGIGYAVSMGVTPFEILWGAVENTDIGIGIKHGFDDGQRAKTVVRTTKQVMKEKSERAIRERAIEKGLMTEEQAMNTPLKQVAKALADGVLVPDSYRDEFSDIPVEAEVEGNPMPQPEHAPA